MDPLHQLTQEMKEHYILRVDLEKDGEKAFGIWNEFQLVTWVFLLFNHHHLERMPVHRNVAMWQTSEVAGMAPKNCNSYPDAIFI